MHASVSFVFYHVIPTISVLVDVVTIEIVD